MALWWLLSATARAGYIFISNSAVSPDAGLAGADALCQTEAGQQGLIAANYLAVLATDTQADPTWRHPNAGQIINVASGSVVGPSLSTVLNGPLTTAVSQRGNTALSREFWIGGVGSSCSSWSSANVATPAVTGITALGVPNWATSSTQTCDTFQYYLCADTTSPPTPAPTSSSPTTPSPTPPTSSPTKSPTSSPTSSSPTSASPTSASPTSASPTSASPTSASPTSASPTSASPTSASPTSASPTSASPTTSSPTTSSPTTPAPTTSTPTRSPTSSPFDSKCRAFVSSAAIRGDMSTGGVKGLAGADAFCTKDAIAKNVVPAASQGWKALLATSTATAASRFGNPPGTTTGPVINVFSGAVIAPNVQTFVTATTGAVTPLLNGNARSIWSGDATNSCTDWTDSSSTTSGAVGKTQVTNWFAQGVTPCDSVKYVVCLDCNYYDPPITASPTKSPTRSPFVCTGNQLSYSPKSGPELGGTLVTITGCFTTTLWVRLVSESFCDNVNCYIPTAVTTTPAIPVTIVDGVTATFYTPANPMRTVFKCGHCYTYWQVSTDQTSWTRLPGDWGYLAQPTTPDALMTGLTTNVLQNLPANYLYNLDIFLPPVECQSQSLSLELWYISPFSSSNRGFERAYRPFPVTNMAASVPVTINNCGAVRLTTTIERFGVTLQPGYVYFFGVRTALRIIWSGFLVNKPTCSDYTLLASARPNDWTLVTSCPTSKPATLVTHVPDPYCSKKVAFSPPFYTYVATTKCEMYDPSITDCIISSPPSRTAEAVTCCYNAQNILVTTGRRGPLRQVSLIDHMQLDVVGWLACDCINPTTTTNCVSKYYPVRPSAPGGPWPSPTGIGVFGDPHFWTLDGKQFLFNGVGEYVFLRETTPGADQPFEVQIRTIAFQPGTGFFASVIAAVAVNVGGSNLTIALGASSYFDVFFDGVQLSLDYDTPVTVVGGTLTLTSKGAFDKITTQLDVGIAFDTMTAGTAIGLILSLPQELKGNVTGLLGNWNDDQNDDFSPPTGPVVPIDSAETDIFTYCQTWQVDDSTTRFYYAAGESHATYTNASFMPTFQTPQFATDTLRDQVFAICNASAARDQCIFDAAVAQSVAMALETAGAATIITEIQQSLNTPPQFYGAVDTLTAMPGEFLTHDFDARDVEGDTFQLLLQFIGGTGLQTSELTNSGLFSWAVPANQPEGTLDLTIIATDARNATGGIKFQIVVMLPTTEMPTTEMPTTETPTTVIPTTKQPTTVPTTVKPTTAKPTTAKPTNKTTTKPTIRTSAATRAGLFSTFVFAIVLGLLL